MCKKRIALVSGIWLALILLAGMFPLNVFAAGNEDAQPGYYMSYKKYKAAVDPEGTKTITYNEITDQISALLE